MLLKKTHVCVLKILHCHQLSYIYVAKNRTTLTSLRDPLAFEGMELCTCITLCWTKQLFSTTLIGPVAFRGRELFVLVLHSAGPDIY